MNDELTAVCRGCGKKLDGKPYYIGGDAYDPTTRKRVPICFYGGYVCSEKCDRQTCLELERTMPGHSYDQSSLLPETRRRIRDHWDNR